MSRKSLVLATVIATFALIGSTAAQAQTVTAYVVHGINGDDFPALMLPTELPVDVFVSDVGCVEALQGLEYGNRVGPLELPAGEYDIRISLADADSPCDGTSVIELDAVALPGGLNATIVAHRTFDGSPGAGDQLGLGVTASPFLNDFTPTGRGKARVIANHAALAPTVDVAVSRDYPTDVSVIPGLTNPTSPAEMVMSQIKAELRPGEWDVALEIDGATVFGPDTLRLKPYTATYIYAVGTFPDTFRYLVFVEDGLKSSYPRAEARRSSPRLPRRFR
jgi:hypothetical protein